jgi:beta-xylosidase
LGVDVPTLLQALRDELPGAEIGHAAGCPVTAPVAGAGADTDTDTGAGTDTGIAEAAGLAAAAEVCVAVVGDRSGLFGRGTSGEGCDAADLTLPGPQGELLDALLATGTPVVLVLLTGRPYALGPTWPRTPSASACASSSPAPSSCGWPPHPSTYATLCR